MRIILAAAFALVAGAAHAEALDLVCTGTALHTETTQSFGTITADNGRSASGDETTYRRARSAESLRVRIGADGTGRIKPPAALTPPISRGKAGWWDLEGLSVTDQAIRGKYSLNMLNHPTVLIDRRTGDIDMKGLGMRFSGNCERAPEEPAGKKF